MTAEEEEARLLKEAIAMSQAEDGESVSNDTEKPAESSQEEKKEEPTEK